MADNLGIMLTELPEAESISDNDLFYLVKENNSEKVKAKTIKDSLLGDFYGEASGNPASFADGASAGLAKCITEIVPKQAGSGTPSPTNVRAISGYTAVKVDVAGKNLSRVNTGTNNVVVAHCIAGQTYTFSIRNQGNCGFNLKKSNSAGEQIASQDASTSTPLYVTFIADEDFDLFLNGFGSGGYTFVSSAYDYQLELGSEPTTYEAYAGSTTTTPLGQTVYSGQLNVLTGELTIDRASVDMGSLEWSYNSTYQRFGAVISDMKPAEANGTPLEGLICSAYATGSANNTSNSSYNGYIGVSTTRTLYARNENYTDATAFTSAVSGQTVVYPLDTPQTVQLTPQEVNSLLGQNNISADTGDVDIVYVKASAPIKPNPSGEPDGYLSSIELDGEKFEIIKELPAFPSSNGNYKLKLSISNGVPTLSWVSDT